MPTYSHRTNSGSDNDDPDAADERRIRKTLARMNLVDDLANPDREAAGQRLRAVEKASHSTDVRLLSRTLDDNRDFIQQQLRTIVDLRAENADLMSRLTTIAALRRRKRKTKVKDEVEEEIDRLIPDKLTSAGNGVNVAAHRAAHLFVYFYNYITPADLLANPCPLFDPNDVAVRYATPENERLADTKELYEFCVKPMYHDFVRLQKDPFPRIFNESANTLRSNAASRLRTSAVAIYSPIAPLFDRQREDLIKQGRYSTLNTAERLLLTYGPALFVREFSDRKKCAAFLQLLGYDSRTGKYSKWCPLLYEGGVPALGKEFRHTVLFRMARTLIHGPHALEGAEKIKKLKASNVLSAENPSATVGFIVFVSILACLLISGDTELNNGVKGNVTGIDWPGNARAYKRHLLTVLKDRETQDLLELWNREVFPNRQKDNNNSPGAGSSNEDGVDIDDDDDYTRRVQQAINDRKNKSQEDKNHIMDDEDDEIDFDDSLAHQVKLQRRQNATANMEANPIELDYTDDDDDHRRLSYRSTTSIASIRSHRTTHAVPDIVVSNSPQAIKEILQTEFAGLTDAITLVDHLDRLANRPCGPALSPSGIPSPDVIAFLRRIEEANPNAPGFDEDDLDEGWGHYQFTAGSLTVRSVLISCEALGDAITALRLIAATLKTCQVARQMCAHKRIVGRAFLSDVYLNRVVETLWVLVKDIEVNKSSASKPSSSESPPQAYNPHASGGSPVDGDSDSDLRTRLQDWKVAQLKAWMSNKQIAFRDKATKADLVQAILDSGNRPSKNELLANMKAAPKQKGGAGFKKS